jgi:hypothetical protein
MKVCVECNFFYNKQDGPRTNVWYNQFCKHPKNRKQSVVDPVSGNSGYQDSNDLGMQYIDEYPFPFARKCNTNGNCYLWEPRQGLIHNIIDSIFTKAKNGKSLLDSIIHDNQKYNR